MLKSICNGSHAIPHSEVVCMVQIPSIVLAIIDFERKLSISFGPMHNMDIVLGGLTCFWDKFTMKDFYSKPLAFFKNRDFFSTERSSYSLDAGQKFDPPTRVNYSEMSENKWGSLL